LASLWRHTLMPAAMRLRLVGGASDGCRPKLHRWPFTGKCLRGPGIRERAHAVREDRRGRGLRLCPDCCQTIALFLCYLIFLLSTSLFVFPEVLNPDFSYVKSTPVPQVLGMLRS